MERIRGEGGELLEEVGRLLHEGNVRRIAIKQGERTDASPVPDPRVSGVARKEST